MAGKYLDPAGLAYFWEQIKLNPENNVVIRVNTIYDLPNIGKPEVIYIIKDEDSIYRWDDSTPKYYCIGRDYNNIELINSGGA